MKYNKAFIKGGHIQDHKWRKTVQMDEAFLNT